MAAIVDVGRLLRIGVPAALVAAALMGCNEKPQVLSSDVQDGVAGNTVAPQMRAWQGEPLPYQAGNFTRGDKASWDKALQTRMQAQNEYVRVGGGAR